MRSAIEEIEQLYASLVGQFEAGEIDEETFESETERLQFQDQDGRIWAIGARTGRWYVHTEEGWSLADPLHSDGSSSQEAFRPRMGKAGSGLTLLLAAGILITCIAVLAGGIWLWQAPGAGSPPAPPQPAIVAAAPTFTPGSGLVLITSTQRPPTATATGTFTPIPTDTPTAEPSATATPSPLPTGTDTSTPTVTPDSTNTPTETAEPTSTPTSEGTPEPTPTETTTATATVAPTDTAAPPPNTPAPPPTPTFTPQPVLAGRILYPVYLQASSWYDIYLQPVDGSERQWIVGQASQPAATQDGQLLAFRSWQPDDRGIRTMRIDGSDRRRITDRVEDGLPAWHTDGWTLSFSSRRESDRVSRIYLTSQNGGEAQALHRNYEAVYGGNPVWLPDGRILYTAIQGLSGLVLMNPDGSGPAQIVDDPSATSPSVSPDGQQIAFMSQRDGNWEVYRVGLDGSNLQRVTNHPGQDGLPAWSPDGIWIGFVSDRSGQWSIWAQQAAGGDATELFAIQGEPGGVVPREPDFSSRGWTEEQIQWLP